MASLCKGGNEPPGSLKANYLVTKRLHDRNLQTVQDMLPHCDIVCSYHVTTGTISKTSDSDVSF